jgi:hypothetical protein
VRGVEFSLGAEAYQTLREPSARLRHLVELSFRLPESWRTRAGCEALLQVAGAVQAARTVSQRLESARSGLARAFSPGNCRGSAANAKTPQRWRTPTRNWTVSLAIWTYAAGCFSRGTLRSFVLLHVSHAGRRVVGVGIPSLPWLSSPRFLLLVTHAANRERTPTKTEAAFQNQSTGMLSAAVRSSDRLSEPRPT